MKINKIILFFALFACSMPVFAFADCSQTGSTIVYINGIRTTEQQAREDLERLRTGYRRDGQYKDVVFLTGYNASHIGSLGDLIKSAIQMYGGGKMDFDLTNILLKLHNELTTQKVILVGHSQGTFYANNVYNYLIGYGADINSIAVYNIATPADTVAGGGKYITSSNDKVIESIARQLAGIFHASEPLPANADLPLPKAEENDPYGGHYFRSDYLAFASDRIIAEIDQALSKLTATGPKKECFIKPQTDTIYSLKATGYELIDSTIENPEVFVTSPLNQEHMVSFRNSVFGGLSNAWSWTKSKFSSVWNWTSSNVSQMFGPDDWQASLTSPLVQDNYFDSGSPTSAPEDGTGGVNTDPQTDQEIQDLIDSILERLDFASQPATAVTTATATTAEQPPGSQNEPNAPETSMVYINYPKILINEVQIGGTFNAKNEFVELYNPNDFDIPLDDWYLQRRTATGQGYDTFASQNSLDGRMIPAKGYFLLARQNSDFELIADYIVVGSPLTENNTLLIKNPNREVVDLVGWGNAQEYETMPTLNPPNDYSISRIWDNLNQISQDTDNNYVDFGLSVPTPKSDNDQGGGPGGGTVTYPKILINEAQISGLSDATEEFVKLYNPNETYVDLTNWYLQRKTATAADYSTFVSKTLFSQKGIEAGSYFTIARLGTTLADSADIVVDIPLTEDNCLVLKKPNQDISDLVGWGQAQEYETAPTVNPPDGGSIIRKALDNGSRQDTDNNLNDFEVRAAVVVPSDTLAPQVVFDLDPTQTQLSFSVDFTITDPVGVVSPSGISSYVFRWQEDGGAWQQDPVVQVSGDPMSADFSRGFDGEDGKTYNFQVMATDVAGNISDWLPQPPATTQIGIPPKILITEVQIAGATADDEFIELYNQNSFDVDLTGFSLKKKTSGGTESNLVSSSAFSGIIISAQTYFLIAPKDNDDGTLNYTGAVVPDLRYSGKVTSDYKIAANNTILLYNNSGALSDKVGYGSAQDYETAPFATNPLASKSIQRIWDSYASQPQDTDNNSVDFYIFDATTPKAVSPEFCFFDTYNNYTFLQDTTLTRSCTYIFRGKETVSPGVTLTIEPGVVIRFASSALEVSGVIKAVGTENMPIVLTSLQDNEHGGVFTAGSVPSAGQWSGIYIKQTSVGSEFENVILRYSGSDGVSGAGIWADRTPISLRNSVIENTLNYGLLLTLSDSVVDSVEFYDIYKRDYSPTDGAALVAEGGNPQISNSTFKRNYDSVYLIGIGLDSYPLVQNNIFEGNYYAIRLAGDNSYPDFSGNTATNNKFNAIVVTEQVEKDITFHFDLPYYINEKFIVPENTTLTIEPGAVVKFLGSMAGSGITVNGTLKAIGNPGQPIVFTSLTDDEHGGDTLSDGQIPGQSFMPCPGQWPGILVNQTSAGSEFENIVLRYAGGNFGGNVGAGIKALADIGLRNSIIQSNLVSGVYLVSPSDASIIDSVQFLSNQSTSAPWTKGLYIQGGSPEVKNSYFAENNYGIYLSSYGAVPATPNLHIGDPEQNIFAPDPNPFDGISYGLNTIEDIYSP